MPLRDWLVDGLIPMRVVTLYYGDGGTGKTLTAMQLIAATALRLEWFGRPEDKPGPTLLYTAEDEADELHRRFAAIVAQSGHQLRDLEGVQVIPMAGLDPTLATQNASGGISMTGQFEKLKKAVEEHKPRLVVIGPMSSRATRSSACRFGSSCRSWPSSPWTTIAPCYCSRTRR